MPAHRIRLRGPWEYEWLAPPLQPPEQQDRSDTKCPAAQGRVKMPIDWRSLFGDRVGKVRFRRRFGCPTNLEPHERVFLVFDGIGGEAQVTLNDRPLGAIAAEKDTAEFEVTGLLNWRNQMTVDIDFDPARSPGRPGGLWAAVVLEMRWESGTESI